MKTINNIFDLFKTIAQEHYQINSFVYGDITELDNYDNINYPVLIVAPITTIVNENTLNHTYRIAIADLVKKDENNQVEVWSDTQQILTDIAKVFRYDSDLFSLIGEPILTPFKERWNDDVSGWQGDFEIEFNFDNSECNIPIDEFLIPGPTPSEPVQTCFEIARLCDVDITSPTNGQVLVYQNGTWVNQNQLGDFLTCETLSECETIIAIQEEIDVLEDEVFEINEALTDIQNNFANFLPLAGGTMLDNAMIVFNSAIDIQSNGVNDYSQSWYYGDENFAQMGFGFNHYLNATNSLIELVALATNSIYQVISDSVSENSRMVANKNGNLAEFIVKPGLPAIYRNTLNNPIRYFGDYFDGDVRSLVDWGNVKSYVDSEVSAAAVAQLKDQGNYDASSNLFPSVANIKTGFLWTISVAGTLGGVNVTTGDVVRALIDSPGQTASNWNITENNIGYVPENNANKVQDFSDPTSIVKFPVVKAIVDYIVSVLASFKTTNFLDATSSIQTQLNNKSSIIGSYIRLAHDYTPVSGTAVTTEEILKVIPVSSSIVSIGDMLEVYSATANTSNANTKTWKMYINTTPDLVGSPVLLATSQMTTNAQSTIFSKKLPVLSLTSLFCYGGPTQSGASPYGSIQASSTILTVPNLSNAFYIIITSQKATASDTVTLNYTELYLTKN
jgi:hypothetical protein